MHFYSIDAYGTMIADQVRSNAYTEALRRAVNPGSVVLDIGTGTGICALLACQFGARRVFAIEPSDAIQVASEIAADNGYADRIEFIQDLSTNIDLPERADVMVSDLRGILPFLGRHFAAVTDARQRLLVPGGIQIPQQDTLWAAVVSAPELYKTFVAPWDEHNYGFNMRAARKLVLNTWGKGRVAPEQLLTEAKSWAQLDYTAPISPNVESTLNWQVTRPGGAHGMLVWFDTVLIPGVGFSNAPGCGATVYGSSFFPWLEPVELQAGDTIQVKLKANLVVDDYIWSWQTVIFEQGDAASVKASFQQSTFFGASLSPSLLHKQAASYVPQLNEQGRIDQFILSLMTGAQTQDEIARQLMEKYPQKFANWRQSLTHIAELSKRYSQ